MKSYTRKKAISPLIASVILIVFTMSIAALLTTWVQSITVEQKKTADDSQKKIDCFMSNLEVDNDFTKVNSGSNPTIFSTRIRNNGANDISLISYRIWDNNTEPIIWKITDVNANKTGIPKGNGMKIVLNISGLANQNAFNKIKILTECEGVYVLIEQSSPGWRVDPTLSSLGMIDAKME